MYPVQFTSLPMKWICQECHIFLMDPEQRNQIYLWGCCIYSPSPLNLNYQPGVLWLLFGESVNNNKKKNWSNLATLWELLYGFLHESKRIKLLELPYKVVTFPKSILFKVSVLLPGVFMNQLWAWRSSNESQA